jgi:hypothetical protein
MHSTPSPTINSRLFPMWDSRTLSSTRLASARLQCALSASWRTRPIVAGVSWLVSDCEP